MAIQQRAERTRASILRAAARVFDSQGYERASLARIGREAEVTTGALTFHFETKADLAEGVRGQAREVTGQAIRIADGAGESAVRKLVAVTHELTLLFATDEVARAGERLARELGSGEGIASECPWRREVARLVRSAAEEGTLRSGADATAVAALITYVVTGVELATRRPGTPAGEPWLGETGALDGSAPERLERIWRLILPALES
ncbi:TetR/AcrR family transcriptional regulator [Streptomyces sp. N2-109]|uniref:TetR/AcrR family transcriptional regulator n=1 Tax=Streptomyces gossypii TaxID=2883101 RepID=A0ABT2K3I9_9ACTN|nr:TetR/AcrR family transcriptional regulator [Streptomyces gossypii]MCT2594726.1 TetR/AcrR family transcriptional regulator [Streptomyces gossypii]